MQLDEPRQIYDYPANKFVADFIGESTFLPITLSNGKATYGGQPIGLANQPTGAGDYALLMRPERLTLVNGKVPKDTNVFAGKVSELVFQGESFLMYATLDDGTEVAVRGATQRGAMAKMPDVGAKIKLGLHKDDSVLIADDGA